MIGPENARHPLNQWESKLNPTVTRLLSFSRSSASLLVSA